MSKTKILIASFVSLLLIIGTIVGTFILLQPKKIIPLENKVVSIPSTKNSTDNPFKKSTFDNSKKNPVVDISTNPDDFKPKKFTDSTGQPIKETDLNTYSQARDENKIYSDDFVNANCESYNLTVNSSQNCYINFRKEILDSEVSKVKAKITPIESTEINSQETDLGCVMLKIEQNPNKNTLSCTTDNLKLAIPGNYNLTLTIGEDILTNSLEKNIEVLTVEEFQIKYNNE